MPDFGDFFYDYMPHDRYDAMRMFDLQEELREEARDVDSDD